VIPSEHVRQLLPAAVEAATDLARQIHATDSYAPTKAEFQKDVDANPHSKLAIVVEAYASALLGYLDHEHARRLAWEKRVEAHMEAVSMLPIWPPGSRLAGDW